MIGRLKGGEFYRAGRWYLQTSSSEARLRLRLRKEIAQATSSALSFI